MCGKTCFAQAVSRSLELIPLLLFVTVLAQASDTDDFNLSAIMEPVSTDNMFWDEDYFNWGSGIVKGDDGEYHLIYSQMPRRHGFYSWLTDGIVSRAVSDSPLGPW